MKRIKSGGTETTRGFTLVELLVVVAIIAVLISILLPSLKKARDQTKAVACRAEIRALGTGAFTYASEWGRYPPSHANLRDLPAAERGAGKDWLGVGGHLNANYVPTPENNKFGGTPGGFDHAPTLGKLWPYVRSEKAYRCRADVTIPIGTYAHYNSSVKTIVTAPGSENWKFSYTMYANMGLRSPEEGVPEALSAPTGGGPRGSGATRRKLNPVGLADTPIFVEEHPEGIGRFNPGHVEGTFNTTLDRVVARHGPFTSRPGYKPLGPSAISSFLQGTTNISFGDGHSASLATNYQVSMDDIEKRRVPKEAVPDRAEELLKYFRIQYQEIWAQPGGGLKYQDIPGL